MKYMLLLWIYLTILFTGTSCQDKIETQLEASQEAVTFTATQTSSDSITTRATDTGFQSGDEIGIYVVRRSGNTSEKLKISGNYADNKRYRIDSNGQLQPYSNADKIYLSKSEVYDFYAYYPYNENLSDPTNYDFYVNMDQTTAEVYTKNDVMIAQNTSGINNGSVSLLFERKFALVETYFEKVAGKVVTSASLNGVKNTAFLNIGTNRASTELNNAGNIKMNLYAENEYFYIFRAILPVQELKGNYLFEFTINDQIVQYKATSVTPLAEGKKSTYLLNMQYRIRAYQRDAGTGNVTGAEKEVFNHGEDVHLAATPTPNYDFAGWYESPMIGWQTNLTKVTDQPDYYFTASKSVWYIALFKCIRQPITLKAITLGGYSNGGITYGNGGEGNQGQLYSIRAITSDGFIFNGWYEDDILVSTELTYVFTVPDHPVTLEARFQKKLVTIKIDCYPSKEVLAPYYDKPSEVVRNYGTEITLYGYILTDSPYTFDGWYENGTYITRDYAYIFTATKNRNLLAKYGLRAFGLGSSGQSKIETQPGFFTRSLNDDNYHPTYMRAGQKLRITGYAQYQSYISEHSIPVTISNKWLIIKDGERIIYQTGNFEDFFFIAPENSTYTFYYSMTIEGRLLPGERAGGTLVISRSAWFVD